MSFEMRGSGGKMHTGEVSRELQSTEILTIARPKEFVKVSSYEESDDEESTVGKMPPSDSDSET
jgi:hypothetical protein